MKVIANLGYNWWGRSGDGKRAMGLIEDAHTAGVDGVCVPCFKADKVYREPKVIEANVKFEMPMELMYDLREFAGKNNLDFYVTPRYPDCVEYLKSINVNRFHVQSGDIKYIPLLEELSGEHVLLSTGFAKFSEVDEASNILLGEYELGESEANVTLLHSTGKLPTPPSEAQFTRMLDLGTEFFPLPYGIESFFDNHGGKMMDYIALAFNPSVIMRRIDLQDRKGLETAYSLDLSEMKTLVDAARSMETVNNPQYYYEEFVEGDFDARVQQMRCKESEYLLPPEQ